MTKAFLSLILALSSCSLLPCRTHTYVGTHGEWICDNSRKGVDRTEHYEVVRDALAKWQTAFDAAGVDCPMLQGALVDLPFEYTRDRPLVPGKGRVYGVTTWTWHNGIKVWDREGDYESLSELSTAHEVGHRVLYYCGLDPEEVWLKWWHRFYGTPI